MKFLTVAVTGDIILIKANIPTPPPCPVVAKSAKPAAPGPGILIRFVLWLVVAIGPLPTLAPSPMTKARFAVLVIIGMALLEVAAQIHIDNSLGLVV